MRAGLLLISLGLLGFFAHSISANAINTDGVTLPFDEILTEIFRDEAQETVVPKAENDKVDAEFEKILQEIFGDTVKDEANPEAKPNLADSELEAILKQIFGDRAEVGSEPRARRNIELKEETDSYSTEKSDENELSETSLPVSSEEETFYWSGDLDKVEVRHMFWVNRGDFLFSEYDI